MALAKMHDIAGCRLIFKNIKTLNKYREELHKARFKHTRVKAEEDPYNYILAPASSGYRGIHDVYKFCSKDEAGKAWDGLQVEIQYRTTYQHAWSTAVEIAGAITGNHTKFDEGEATHKRFFQLASEIIARVYEESTSCCSDLSNAEVVKQFLLVENKIRLLEKLKKLKLVTPFFNAATQLKRKNLILYARGSDQHLQIYSYDTLPEATKAYFELEKNSKDGEDIVLVRAESQENIKQAFKNYFSDTKDFIGLIEQGLIALKKS